MNLHSYVYFNNTPNSINDSPWRPNSFHTGGVNVAFVDGSVHFLYDTVDADVFAALATIAGQELITQADLE